MNQIKRWWIDIVAMVGMTTGFLSGYYAALGRDALSWTILIGGCFLCGFLAMQKLHVPPKTDA